MKYLVVTPEYSDGGSEYEPPEYGCDVVEVEAPTKRAAIIAGVKRMLAGSRRAFPWVHYQRGDGCSPFTGVKAIEMREPTADEKMLAAYCDLHPNDRTARLIYADAVQEAGDEEMAAILRGEQ